MNQKPVNITEVISIRTLEKIQDNFSKATGVGSIIRDLKGNAITKGSNLSELWLTIIKNKAANQESLDRLLAIFDKCLKTGQTEIFNRYFDTYAFVVPIFFEGRISAFFIGGLARYGNPNIDQCAIEAKKLNVDLDTFLEMYLSIPLVREERLYACADLIKIIASTISSLAKEGSQFKIQVDAFEKKYTKSSRDLKISESRYGNLFNTINDGIYFTDTNGIVVDINKTGANFFGYEPSELVGTDIKNMYVNPQDRLLFLDILFKKGHVERFRPYVKLRNGERKYIETNSTLIKDGNGNTVGVQGIFRILDVPREHSSLKDENETLTTDQDKLKDNIVTPEKT